MVFNNQGKAYRLCFRPGFSKVAPLETFTEAKGSQRGQLGHSLKLTLGILELMTNSKKKSLKRF